VVVAASDYPVRPGSLEHGASAGDISQ